MSNGLAYLLDSSALIALVIADHEQHAQAAPWAGGIEGIALCPIVEGALIRFLVRAGEAQITAVASLSALYRSPRCDFWEDAISYEAVDLGHVVGHRQVTDAYLVALAQSRGGRLATFDRELAEALPGSTELIG